MTKVAIIGASGFTGAELMRICAGHPSFEVAAVTGDSMAGKVVADLYPSLATAYPKDEFITHEQAITAEYDLAFCALPHGAAQSIAGELSKAATHLVDLSADFRFDDPSVYSQWYGEDHTAPELLDEFVFGLPELYRHNIRKAKLIASPGCYVTAASLALAPLVAAGAVEPTGIVVDAASGVSGAGRAAKPHTTFCAVEENFTAYGLLRHRHTPEIEMAIARHAGIRNVQVLFTPHLAPMNRGILATCYARPTSSAGSASTDAPADTARMSITDTGSTSAGSASTDAPADTARMSIT
ncbi:MAG: N-acetyl-gamma-glutamyl-phosphate reductase, partial [Acidimicrobiaceae bacterium]|nr:N-acetyl-gamma-glutamyl-phosphate reductase [Acidimicrobiaceae bacterium]